MLNMDWSPMSLGGMRMSDNSFDGCEDQLFAVAADEYIKQRNEAINKAACKLEKRKILISSDRYIETLKQMSNLSQSTTTQIGQMYNSILNNIKISLPELESSVAKSFDSIKKQASISEKIIKLTSRQNKVKLFSLLISSFIGGVIITVFIYHSFIIGIMNKYLHHTIEIMAQQEIIEAQKEAELILRNANIKADGILNNAKTFVGAEDKNNSLRKKEE